MPVTIHVTPSRIWSGASLTKLIQLTKGLLTPLEQVQGVKGGFVLDNHGTVIGSFGDSSITASQLTQIGRCLAQIIAVFELHKSKPKELECRFKDTNLYIRDMDNALVAVLFTPNVSFSLMRMQVNVAAAPIAKDMDLQIQLKKAAESCTDTLTDDYLSTDAMRWFGQIKQAP